MPILSEGGKGDSTCRMTKGQEKIETDKLNSTTNLICLKAVSLKDMSWVTVKSYLPNK